MSKIVTAVNVMIMQREKISSVLAGQFDREVFFLYDAKHKWSILKNDSGDYVLSYYPKPYALESYAQISPEEWDDTIDVVMYRSKELGTKEAKQSFAELYNVAQEMKYGMDNILDDIISADIPF
jgi:hypothetical protein